MFQRRVNHDWHCFGCTSYLQLRCCPNGAVLCKELTLFYKQLGLGTSPQIWFCIRDFQGSKLLNGCLGNSSLTKCIPVNFQPLSLIYCIPLAKDQSSFAEFNLVNLLNKFRLK